MKGGEVGKAWAEKRQQELAKKRKILPPSMRSNERGFGARDLEFDMERKKQRGKRG